MLLNHTKQLIVYLSINWMTILIKLNGYITLTIINSLIHLVWIDNLGTGTRSDNLLSTTSKLMNIVESRSAAAFLIILLSLFRDILLNDSSTSKSTEILKCFNVMNVGNRQKRWTHLRWIVTESCKKFICHRFHVSAICRGENDSWNDCTRLLVNNITILIGNVVTSLINHWNLLSRHELQWLKDIVNKNLVEECTHVLAINRILEYIDSWIRYFRSIFIRIVDEILIPITLIEADTIKFLENMVLGVRDTSVDVYAHAMLLIDIIDSLRNFIVSIGRDHSNIKHILLSSLTTLSLNMIDNLLGYTTKIVNKNLFRNIVLLICLYQPLEDQVRKNTCSSSAITNLLNCITSNVLNILTNRHLDWEIHKKVLNDGHTILGVNGYTILIGLSVRSLDGCSKSIRTKSIVECICNSSQCI